MECTVMSPDILQEYRELDCTREGEGRGGEGGREGEREREERKRERVII
jgi:hypothetical protein